MGDLLVLASDSRGVYTLTIRRPEVRNALNSQAFREMVAACDAVAADPAARALVVAGEGKAFSTGGDFETLRELLDGDRDHAVAELRNANTGILALAGLSVPTVAALHGDAYGGGAAVALSTDFRIMAHGARLGFVFSRLGLSGADTGATWWLSRLVGVPRAMEILSLGHVFDAGEALEAGLVNEVVDADGFDAAVNAFGDRLAGLAPGAVRGTKRALAGIEGRSLEEQLDLEADIQADAITSADFREGLEAFQARRPPRFKGI
ncbi:MAG: enoyl-CoA hydratase-related protein [Acidimicrobiia bacterium]|nr:enoyl-CoA hydratase-related protein [Acidimicrobiia bacterium]